MRVRNVVGIPRYMHLYMPFSLAVDCLCSVAFFNYGRAHEDGSFSYVHSFAHSYPYNGHGCAYGS